MLGLSQADVQLLGTMLNFGSWSGVAGGLVLDHLGPRATALGGALLMFLGSDHTHTEPGKKREKKIK